jgi:NAD(P)-dependent dehydrogenase (short-subunit alcohol dehydrogenase family)
MHDVLGYAGKRVIVTGTASDIGTELVRLLVDHGAEVHAIDTQRPRQRDIASFTEADLRDPEQLESAVAKIGSVVNGLFHCPSVDEATPLDVVLVQFCALRRLTETVVANMIGGAAVASATTGAPFERIDAVTEIVATPDYDSARQWYEEHGHLVDDAVAFSAEAVAVYTAARAPSLATEHAVRINCVAVAGASPDDAAWPLLFVNSPRASSIAGAVLHAGARPVPPPSS